MLARWKKISSKKVFHCRWLEVIKDKVRLPDKKVVSYFSVVTPPSVYIIPVTSNNELIMVRQYRYPVRKFSLEFPAGRVEKGSFVSSAHRELEEEAGYRAKKMIKIGQFVPWNGVGTEVCHVFLAKNLIKTKQKLDEKEFIEVLKIPLKKFLKMIETNKIDDGMTLAAFSLARKYLKNQ